MARALGRHIPVPGARWAGPQTRAECTERQLENAVPAVHFFEVQWSISALADHLSDHGWAMVILGGQRTGQLSFCKHEIGISLKNEVVGPISL